MECYVRLVVTPNVSYAEALNGDVFPVPVTTLAKAAGLTDLEQGAYLIKVNITAECLTHEQPKPSPFVTSVELPTFVN